MPQRFMIGEHRRQATPVPATSSVAIPAGVVRHTVQQLVLQDQKLVTNASHIQMFESQEAVRMGVPAFARGPEIYFAPGAFQPQTETGRKLIEQQLACMSQPCPTPIPCAGLSSSSQSAPSHSNVPNPMNPNVNSSVPPSPGSTPPMAPSMSRPMIGAHRF